MTNTTYTATFEGHNITATLIDGVWEAQIDAQTPVMERDFYMRSTYCSVDLETVIRVAMCQIAGESEVIYEGAR